MLVSAGHRRSDAYGNPAEPYYYPAPVGGNSSQAYRPAYYISTMHSPAVLNELHLLQQLEEWIGPSLTGSLFPSPLIYAQGTGSVALELDAEQYSRMKHIYNVIEHVHAAAGYDRGRTADALTRVRALGAEAAIDHLQAGRCEEAYLIAIQAIRPRRDNGLVTGCGTRRALDATVAFLDED